MKSVTIHDSQLGTLCVRVFFWTVLMISSALFAQQPNANTSAPDQAEQPITIKPGVNVRAPRLVYTRNPTMPENGLKGIVIIECVVGTDGRVHEPKLKRSLSPQNDASALEVIREWKFEPGRKDGKPVPVKLSIGVSFF
jgi:TonB family protein